ncbi:pentapeptide repeat-containing protein [Streptomyces sp. NPDC050433]
MAGAGLTAADLQGACLSGADVRGCRRVLAGCGS